MPTNLKSRGAATLWLIILGFVLIAGSGYWFWVDDIKPYLNKKSDPAWFVGDENRLNNEIKKNSAETLNWQTYRNEKYGFEVKYPANWTKSGAWHSDPDPMPYLLNEGVTDPSNQFRSLHIFVFEKKYLAMFDFADQGFNFSGDTLRVGDEFFAKKNDIVIQLSFTYEKPNPELADKIMSTFKFLK